MIRVKLREAMEGFRARSGIRMTYEHLAQLTGLSRATLESLASRPNYNTRLSTIERICRALECQPADLLEFSSEEVGDGPQD